MKKITIVLSKTMLVLALLLNFQASCENVYLKKIDHVSSQQLLPSLAPMLERIIPAVISINVEGQTAPKDASASFPLKTICQIGSESYGSSICHIAMRASEKNAQSFNALGSGVIINAYKGYAITNSHVVENGNVIYATLHDGRSYKVKVIGKDEHADIALIQLIDASNLSEIKIADSDFVRVGDYTIAIGNPYGLGDTVTYGIVSALGRSGLHIEHYEDFIQTDAAINRGNSGGALLNLKGELIGINTAMLAPSGGSIGIGFSIPMNIVKNLIEQIALFGEVKRGELGIVAVELNADLAEVLKIDLHQGGFISQVIPYSSAFEAGIKPGDIIISLNNKKISSFSSLRAALGSLPADTNVILGIFRDGKFETFTLLLKSRMHSKNIVKDIYPGLEGIQISNNMLNKQKFVRVDDVTINTAAFHIGFRKNDIILSLNKIVIQDLKELKNILEKRPPIFVFSIKRGNRQMYLVSD